MDVEACAVTGGSSECGAKSQAAANLTNGEGSAPDGTRHESALRSPVVTERNDKNSMEIDVVSPSVPTADVFASSMASVKASDEYRDAESRVEPLSATNLEVPKTRVTPTPSTTVSNDNFMQQIKSTAIAEKSNSSVLEARSTPTHRDSATTATVATSSDASHADQPSAVPTFSACCMCGQRSVGRCPNCISRHYCSRNCQVRDWQTHRVLCTGAESQPQQPTTKVSDIARKPDTVCDAIQTGPMGKQKRSCCCHTIEQPDGHHFVALNIGGVVVDLATAKHVRIADIPVPDATIPSLLKQCELSRERIYSVARDQSLDPCVVVAQVHQAYKELQQHADHAELLRAQQVESILDGILNVIQECRICYLGAPCWDLLQYYVNLFLGERIRYDRDFRERLRLRVTDVEQVLAACSQLSNAEELISRLTRDIGRMKVFLMMWNPAKVAPSADAPEFFLYATLAALAASECQTAATQITLAQVMKTIESGGHSDPDIISRRTMIMNTEAELAQTFSNKVRELATLIRAEVVKTTPDANVVIALCFGVKALACRSMLLRGQQHSPLPNTTTLDGSKAKLKRCADDFATARTHYSVGDYAQAIDLFERVLLALPQFYLCWYLLGTAHLATRTQNGYKVSIKAFQTVLLGGAQNAEVYYFLGTSLQETRDWQGAVQAFENALSLSPTHSESKQRLDICQKVLQGVDLASFARAPEEALLPAEAGASVDPRTSKRRAGKAKSRAHSEYIDIDSEDALSVAETRRYQPGKRKSYSNSSRNKRRREDAGVRSALELPVIEVSDPMSTEPKDTAPEEEVDVDGLLFYANDGKPP